LPGVGEIPKSFEEFGRVATVIPGIVKIQSHFKKNSACIKVQKMAEERKTQIADLRQA